VEEGVLYIIPPPTHTADRLRELLDRAGCAPTEPSPNLVAVRLGRGVLSGLAELLSRELSQPELNNSRSLILEEGSQPSLADLGAMQPLSTLVARVRGEWFTAMLREQRLTSVFQPIVRAEEPEDIFAYECLLRGVNSDSTLMPPDRLYEAARAADLLFPLDRAARLTAIREAATQWLDKEGSHLFINFNPTSVYDPVFCLRSTTAAIAATELRPEQVVFEVVESDQISDIGHLVRIIDYYRSAGFKVALDDLGSGYGSLNLLGDLKPDFVKLDMRLIRGVDNEPYKAAIVGKLLEMAHKLDVATVAEGIETVEEWEWVRDHGAHYLQGYLFARPASPPPRPRSPMRSVLSS
jgi:EAL domain-containing protein (putative c-di-GMP-specific phosphodiesterase class I)